MELLAHLMSTDPSSPRLTVYDESQGSRLDFSAQTLDNWTAKVGNMLLDELDLEEGSAILLALPVGWQAAAIALGALAAGVETRFDDRASTDGDGEEVDVVFTSVERAAEFADLDGADLVLVTDDPFGRGVTETGGELPAGAIDFGPTVRFYGDQFPHPTPALTEIVATDLGPERLLTTGWTDRAGFSRQVLEPLAAGGSTVIVAGLVDSARLDEIASAEKVTKRL
ncbi:TIGR03089 family protein [Corynebacterium halotolerans]|uniref:TIGR03089 family protein n=1 Tax=Corynebacterium halotolerans YIM 70093 = DSM 44683 TaxID=1121362 RepID=M1P4X0_9CORY|nr:TIGR03089 family protein [Corynebacterium halotolerans]AGF71711.1 hypothetical protein A605_03500 [Corynebacterium halotolerans YIM 70093 = DSM 44683]